MVIPPSMGFPKEWVQKNRWHFTGGYHPSTWVNLIQLKDLPSGKVRYQPTNMGIPVDQSMGDLQDPIDGAT